MKTIMTEELIERIEIAPALLSTKGIIVANNWKESKPITLRDLIGIVMRTLPNVLWLIDDEEEKDPEGPAPAAAEEEPEPEAEAKEEADPAPAAAQVEKSEPAAESDEGPAPAAAAAEAAEEKPAEGGAAEPEQPKEEKAQDILDGFVAHEPKRATRRKTLEDLGEWEEYRRRALTTSEQNEVIKGMTEEGFSIAVIAQVIRTSPQTVCNRRQKMGIAPPEKEAKANGC